MVTISRKTGKEIKFQSDFTIEEAVKNTIKAFEENGIAVEDYSVISDSKTNFGHSLYFNVYINGKSHAVRYSDHSVGERRYCNECDTLMLNHFSKYNSKMVQIFYGL